jgi:hypothetical protein
MNVSRTVGMTINKSTNGTWAVNATTSTPDRLSNTKQLLDFLQQPNLNVLMVASLSDIIQRTRPDITEV